MFLDVEYYENKPKQARQDMNYCPVVPCLMAGFMSGNVQTNATDG